VRNGGRLGAIVYGECGWQSVGGRQSQSRVTVGRWGRGRVSRAVGRWAAVAVAGRGRVQGRSSLFFCFSGLYFTSAHTSSSELCVSFSSLF